MRQNLRFITIPVWLCSFLFVHTVDSVFSHQPVCTACNAYYEQGYSCTFISIAWWSFHKLQFSPSHHLVVFQLSVVGMIALWQCVSVCAVKLTTLVKRWCAAVYTVVELISVITAFCRNFSLALSLAMVRLLFDKQCVYSGSAVVFNMASIWGEAILICK